MLRRILQDKLMAAAALTILTMVLAGVFAPLLAPHDPNEADIINAFDPWSWQYPFGTDNLGRCILSRILYGIRTTIFYSFITMVLTMAAGTFLGMISGYSRKFFGGIVDRVLMRACDIMLSFPYEVMVLIIVGVLGPGITNIVIANFVAKAPWYTRMVRSSVLRFTHLNYVLYSEAAGSRPSYILRRHLLPGIAPELLVLATLDIGWIIISISTLSFLGLGVQLPTAEWGAMLSEAKEVFLMHPEQMLMPGLAIMIAVSAFNLLGDGFRDILDPKEVRR